MDFLKKVRPEHVVITAGNQVFSGTMLPGPKTFDRIEQVSQELILNTKVWRTDLGDKSPLKPVGTEGGDETVVLRTQGTTIEIGYIQQAATPGLDPTRCQAITLQGTQCKRKPASGGVFCWQHSE